MEREIAELSSVTSQLESLTQRVVAVAEVFGEARRDDVAADLFEVERSLRTAMRRLARAQRSIRG